MFDGKLRSGPPEKKVPRRKLQPEQRTLRDGKELNHLHKKRGWEKRKEAASIDEIIRFQKENPQGNHTSGGKLGTQGGSGCKTSSP